MGVRNRCYLSAQDGQETQLSDLGSLLSHIYANTRGQGTGYENTTIQGYETRT
jgi:hypothetical protein